MRNKFPITRFSYSPLVTLPLRTLLFISLQAMLAFILLLCGSQSPWVRAAAWWPFIVTAANLINILLLINYMKSQGRSYRSLFMIDTVHLKDDLKLMALVLLITAPVAFLPNTISARLLFSDALVPVQLLFQPIPVPAIILSMIVFPITQALAEIPLYMACAMPELVKKGRPRWLSLALPAFFLGAQHIAVPLLFNGPFILWRLLMYMPFAFLIGIVMRYRPRLLPYLVILHLLMDISAGAMYFAFPS
jgi:hypothetical protein